jgi:hypothetical protein
MLREDLKNSDIPHRTALTEHIMKMLDVHLVALQEDMKVGCCALESFNKIVT